MKAELLEQTQALHQLIEKLLHDTSPLDDDQTEDVIHMTSALKEVERLAEILDQDLDTVHKRLQALHDLSSPINGIIGYLFILEQEYTAPLTPEQLDLVKTIETKILDLYKFLTDNLTVLHPDS